LLVANNQSTFKDEKFKGPKEKKDRIIKARMAGFKQKCCNSPLILYIVTKKFHLFQKNNNHERFTEHLVHYFISYLHQK